MSIGKYILNRRMEEAKRLLQETPMSISEIGAAVGLPDASYFCRIFRKATGTTPLKYRKSVHDRNMHPGPTE